MPSEFWTAFAGILVAIITSVGAFTVGRRKNRDDFLTSGFNLLATNLQAENKRLREEIESLRGEITLLRTEISHLTVRTSSALRSTGRV